MPNPTQSRRRILVVDDEPSVRQTVRIILAREGYDVQIAGSGAEALTVLKLEQLDLVITDFKMPGMTGDELAKIIRERWPATSVVMLTACADSLRASHTGLPGVDVLLNKPFGVESFRKTIAMVLSETNFDENASHWGPRSRLND